MDVITAVLQAPVNTILIIAGVAIVFFALFEISKGTVRLRTEKANIVPIIVGAVFIISGLFYKSQTTSPGEPTLEPGISIGTQTPVPLLETPSLATETQAPSIVSSNTPEPTLTPQIKTLADGCFASQTWKANSINAETLNAVSSQDNCLNLNSLGITVEAGGKIRLLASAPKAKGASGISLSITDQSVIEFKFSIDSLYIVYPDEAAYITFGIAPAEDPTAERGAGRFKFVVEKTGNGQTVFYFLANVEQSFGSKWPSQHPSYGRTYSVHLVLKNLTMEIYIDGVKLKEEVTIPTGAKVFNIGYYMPVQAGADVEITDLTIDGKIP